MLAEKPVISDDSNQLDPSLLDDLLANIATLSSVYHKPPDAFVTRVKTIQRAEDDEYPEGTEAGYSDSSTHPVDSRASSAASSSNAPHPATRQLTTTTAAPSALPDLLDLGLESNNSAIVSVDEPATATGYARSVLLLNRLDIEVMN